MSLHRLCTTFMGLAEWMRRTLRTGYRAGIYVGEESLTDFALIRVATRNPQHVRTRKFTRAQEGTQTGADWLWLFGSEDEFWIPLLIQAKVMHPRKPPRALLTYRNGEQNRLLQEFALENRLFPAYCVYNAVPELTVVGSDVSYCGLRVTQYACALLTLSRRQQLLTERTTLSQSGLLSRTIPLASLVCCRAKLGRSDELAFRIADLLEIASEKRQGERDGASSELEEALLGIGPRDTIIDGHQVEEFIARIQEASIHRATGRPLLAGVAQFSTTPFSEQR
jgi:hypothetical protein